MLVGFGFGDPMYRNRPIANTAVGSLVPLVVKNPVCTGVPLETSNVYTPNVFHVMRPMTYIVLGAARLRVTETK